MTPESSEKTKAVKRTRTSASKATNEAGAALEEKPVKRSRTSRRQAKETDSPASTDAPLSHEPLAALALDKAQSASSEDLDDDGRLECVPGDGDAVGAVGIVEERKTSNAEDDASSQVSSDCCEASSMAASDKPIEQYTPREIGCEGERLAASYLVKRGYEVIERNWRCSAGEVDIIAKDDDATVLVEVKTRLALGESGDTMPELAVDRQKQRRYRKLALLYLACHPDVNSVRFDVIALNIVGERCARLRHLIGAFCWDDCS